VTAQRKGPDYKLNGRKDWIINGPIADIFIVYAQTQQDDGTPSMTAFLVEKNFDGFSSTRSLETLGMRGAQTSTLAFEDCLVPAENILGQVHGGDVVLKAGAMLERVILAAGPLGLMQACFDEVTAQGGDENEQIAAQLTGFYSRLSACRSYLYMTALACSQGTMSAEEGHAVILFLSKKASHMALAVMSLMGKHSYDREARVGRLLRDATFYEMGVGTAPIHNL